MVSARMHSWNVTNGTSAPFLGTQTRGKVLGKFRPRIQIGGVTDFGKSGSEADFTPPDLPLQIKNCPSQRFYLGRSEKTVIVTSARALADSLQHATGGHCILRARCPSAR